MKNTEEILARRYAQAFINQFGTELDADLIDRLLLLADIIHPQRALLVYASLKDTQVESIKILNELFEAAGFGTLFASLITLVADQKRLELLPRILRVIHALYLDQQGIMHFTIESTIDLTQEEQDAFVSYLQKKTDKKIRYTLVNNPALIAGVKMYSNTLSFEHSVRQRLDELSQKIV